MEHIQQLPKKIQTTLTDFQSHLLDQFSHEINQIILYGSYARGEAKPESDVDLMVVVPWQDVNHAQGYYLGNVSDPRWQLIVDLAVDMMIAHGPFISVLVVGEALFDSSWEVVAAAKTEGVVLWQKPLI